MFEPRSENEIAAHKEHLLNVTVAAMGALSVLGLIGQSAALVLGTQADPIAVVPYIATLLLYALAYGLGRRGLATWAGYVLALTVWGGLTAVLSLGAWPILATAVAGYALAVILAIWLTGWVGGLILCALSLISYSAVEWLVAAGRLPDLLGAAEATTAIGTAILGAILLVLAFLARLHDHRLRSLAAAEIEQARAAARELERRAAERQELLAQIEAQEARQERLLDAMRQASTPVLPLSAGLILMPLSGQLSSLWVERLIDDMLEGIAAHGADHVLLDLTGLVGVDDDAIPGLIKAIQGARLLGSSCRLVGVGSYLAEQLVDLGLDLEAAVTYSTLREGIADLAGGAGGSASKVGGSRN